MKYTTKEIADYLGTDIHPMRQRLRKMGYTSCGYGKNNMSIWDIDSLEGIKEKFSHYMKTNQKETITLYALAKHYDMSGALIYKYLKSKDILPEIDNYKNPVYLRSVCEILNKIDRIDNSDHPLITDKRCLNQNWWPDTVPKCFEGLDDD